MKCFCEDCKMNEENFGEMNYSDEFQCHKPYRCRDCPCFDECMEQKYDYDEFEDDFDDEFEDSEDEDYCGYFDGE